MTQKNERQQMAALLRQKTKKILEDWESAVRERVPGDAQLEKSLLYNSLHLLLENLAGALDDAAWTYHAARNVEIALEHAQQRYRVNVHQFDQVVDEYAEMRRAIIRNIASDKRCTAQGVEVVHAFVDASIKHASGFFAELRHRDDKQALADQRDSAQEERDEIRGHAGTLEQERRLRSEVISMLGHDMRTPLAGALLAAQLMEKRSGDADKRAQKASQIRQSLERLDEMLQNLLDADKLRSGQPHPVTVGPNDITRVFDRAVRELTAIYGERFVTVLPRELAGYWDGGALQRVVENLGSNAVKYGSPSAAVLLKAERHGSMVELEVHNDGPPIALSDLNQLFTPHYRANEAEVSAEKGWGLGLALVKAVADAHGGSVAVDSAKGRGTTFRVRLPVDCRTSGMGKNA